MSTVKRRVLVNPGRRKNRKLSPLQKLYFGSKRQRAAVRRNRGGLSRAVKRARRTTGHDLGTAQSRYKRRRSERRFLKRQRNISSIVTVYPNPGLKKTRKVKYGSLIRKWWEKEGGKKKNMARHRRRRNRGYVSNRRRRYTRRRRNAYYGGKISRGIYRYTSQPTKKRGRRRNRRNPGRVIVRYRNRRRNMVRNRRHRNPSFGGMMQGTAGKVLGVIGGVAITKLVMGFVPVSLNTGVLGYLTSAVVAVAQGKLIGKMSGQPSLGDNFMAGGLAYVVARVLNDFLPSLGAYTGISGMGLLGGTSFFVPTVNQPGTMGTMMVPGNVNGAIAAMAAAAQPATPTTGVGKLRRTGRLM